MEDDGMNENMNTTVIATTEDLLAMIKTMKEAQKSSIISF